jgi:hypothetical protein
MNDEHIIDYIEFNHEQTEWWNEQQMRQARHAEWLEKFMNDMPHEMRTDM